MTTRTVAIIGAGNMGRGLVRRLTSAGHTVLVTDHDLDRAKKVAVEAADSRGGDARAVPVDEALTAEIIVIALWYPGTTEFALAHRYALSGKIVVDISNPLDASFTQLSLAPTTSSAEELAAVLPSSRVVKAFNTVPGPTLFAGAVQEQSLDSFVASDDVDAKTTVLALMAGTGLRGIDAGVLANSRLLERLTAFGIELGQRYGLGFDFGFKYLPTSTLPAEGSEVSASPVDIVRRFLENADNPAVITELVAEDATYISLNSDAGELHQIMPWAGTKHGRQAFLDNLRDIFTFWTNEEWTVTEVFGQDERVAAFGTFTHRSTTLRQTATTPFSVFAKVVDSKIVYFQFQEDTFATARSFRSGGTWTIQSDPQGEPFEI